MKKNFEKYLYEFLKLYWLRPENAIWRTFDAIELEKIKYSHYDKILDLGCGDGTVSFILLGGEFDISFDYFNIINNSSADIYDCFQSTEINIKKFPKQNNIYGADLKFNLLKKSLLIADFYKLLVNCDFNKSVSFKNNSFSVIFSNIR